MLGVSSSFLYLLFLTSAIEVLLLTILLLLLCSFRDVIDGDSCSVQIGGEGGELDEGELEGGYVEGGEVAVHVIGSNPGWKNAGFAVNDNPDAAIN